MKRIAMTLIGLAATLAVPAAFAGPLDPDCTVEKAAKGAAAKNTIGVGGRCKPGEVVKDSVGLDGKDGPIENYKDNHDDNDHGRDRDRDRDRKRDHDDRD